MTTETLTKFETDLRNALGEDFASETRATHLPGLASAAFHAIGMGMVLRIAHEDGAATLIEGQARYGKNRPTVEVPRVIARDLIWSGLLWHLTARRWREDEDGYRLGWKDLGLDGTTADFFVCLQ